MLTRLRERANLHLRRQPADSESLIEQLSETGGSMIVIEDASMSADSQADCTASAGITIHFERNTGLR